MKRQSFLQEQAMWRLWMGAVLRRKSPSDAAPADAHTKVKAIPTRRRRRPKRAITGVFEILVDHATRAQQGRTEQRSDA
jgi:hypothetical protein